MIHFFRRFRWPITLAVVGLFIAVMCSTYLEAFKEGFNPYVFVMKLFAKSAYVGTAIMFTHFVVKKWFPTVQRYCETHGDSSQSLFQADWAKHREGTMLNPKIGLAIQVHLLVFLGICVLLALAF